MKAYPLTDYQIDTCDKVLHYLLKNSTKMEKIWFEFDADTPEIHFSKCINHLKEKDFISESPEGAYKLTPTGKAFIVGGGFQANKKNFLKN